MGLKLSLKPGEKFAVNGAVIVNGGRRGEITIENRADVLRERDIMRAEEATTPARRVYLPVMMMTLDASSHAEVFGEFEQRLTEFAGAVSDPAGLGLCLKIAAAVANGEHYKALALCRALIEFESERLPDVA